MPQQGNQHGRSDREGTPIELFSPDWAPFTVALIVMLAIGVIEAASLVIGFSPSASLESALPDIDVPDGPELSGAEVGPLSAVLGWLSVGRLPLLILLVIFLTAFGLAGWGVQALATATIGGSVSAWVATVPALVGGAFATRHLGRWLGRIFPRDHSEVASQQELVGSFATIIRGVARKGQPAEAKAQDLRGRTHYLLLEPSEPGVTYGAGDRVFIVSKDRSIYRAVDRLPERED